MSAIQQGLLASYASGSSPISLLAHTAKGAATNVTTDPIDTTGATLLVLAAARVAGAISDSKSNTWVPLTAYPTAGFCSAQLYYVKNPTVGSGHTFSCLGSDFPAIAVIAFNHTDTTANADGDSGANATATTLQPGSITPSVNNSVVVTMLASIGASAAVDSGFTITDHLPFVGATNFEVAMAYKVQTTAAAVNPTWNITISNQLAVAITSFKHS